VQAVDVRCAPHLAIGGGGGAGGGGVGGGRGWEFDRDSRAWRGRCGADTEIYGA